MRVRQQKKRERVGHPPLAVSPGNANLPIGVAHTANGRLAFPGFD